MAETVNGLTVELRIYGTVTGDDGAKLTVDETYKQTFSDGSGEDQVGYVWQDLTRPLNTTTEDLNLDALTDFQGATMTGNNNVAVMYFRNLDDDTGDSFKLGGAPSAQFVNWVGNTDDKVIIPPGGIFLMVTPLDKFGITAGSGDLLRVEALDNSNYRVILSGDNA